MKLFKRLLILELLAFSIFLAASCKTKQELVEEDKFKEDIEKRASETEDLLNRSGLDASAVKELVDGTKEIDEKVMNFLATDPDAASRSAMLKKLAKERETSIRAAMTEEEYRAYRQAVRDRKLKKSKETGGPARTGG